MKDFLPTFTFGFLMAQLFPGAVTVLSLSCTYVAAVNEPRHGLTKLFTAGGDLWFMNTRNTVVFTFLSAAVGMLIHGVSWLILAGMEDKTGHGIREFSFHTSRVARQILLAPGYIVVELFYLLNAKKLEDIKLEENVSSLDPKLISNFNYLQDFYLYFAQFFVHMSYALLISVLSFLISVRFLGFGWLRAGFLVFLYFMTSAFFLIGRAQFMTLFWAEVELIGKTPSPDESPVSLTFNVPPEVAVTFPHPLDMDVSVRGKVRT